MTSSFKSILPDSNGIILEESAELDEEPIPTEPALEKGSDRLTVAPVGDYCIRMSNTLSTDDDQQDIELNESRPSDALGYLRMYQNDNRVRYNALEFNDREDLQVSTETRVCRTADYMIALDSHRWSLRCTVTAHLRR